MQEACYADVGRSADCRTGHLTALWSNAAIEDFVTDPGYRPSHMHACLNVETHFCTLKCSLDMGNLAEDHFKLFPPDPYKQCLLSKIIEDVVLA